MQPNAQPVCVACQLPSASQSSGTLRAQRRVSGVQEPWPASPPAPAPAPGPVPALPPLLSAPAAVEPAFAPEESPEAPPVEEARPPVPPVARPKSRLESLQLAKTRHTTAAGTKS